MTDQQQFLDVIDLAEAHRRFLSAIPNRPLGVETVELTEALGRTLSSDIVAQVNVPSFDRSNFDGYAVQACDTVGASEERPISLNLSEGSIKTGEHPTDEVRKGCAVRISTGAMIPRGADAIVMVEDTDENDQQLLIRRSVIPGFGVSATGSDIAYGERVLKSGQQLTSRETGVLAAIGQTQVSVWKRPVVAIISTGDEIIPPHDPMQPGLVHDSNARILSDAVRELGAIPLELGIAIDEEAALRKLVEQARQNADVIVLSGGTSKGEGDLSYRVIQDFKNPGIVVHGVALKPGKPVCLAIEDHQPIVILPGFPTSAVFTFHEFVAPIIRVMGGMPSEQKATLPAELNVRVNSQSGRTEYLLVWLVEKVESDEVKTGDRRDSTSARYAAFPLGKGSGSVTTFSHADGFITIDRHQEFIESGTVLPVALISHPLKAADLVVIGSHCPGLDLLTSELQNRGLEVKTVAVGSTAGLNAIRLEQGDLAGVHLLDPESDQYNHPFLDSDLELLSGYRRNQGIVFRRGDERFANKTVQEVQRTIEDDPDLLMMNRNVGSGTRILIDQFLGGHEPSGYSNQAKNHHAVVAAVHQHRADWGVAVQHAIGELAVDFLPIRHEHFDFVVSRKRLERQGIQMFRKLLNESEIRKKLEAMGFAFTE